MTPAREREKGESGSEAPRKLFWPRPFSPQKTSFLSTEVGPLYTKSFINERAKMKESRPNYREVRMQDDNITENTSAES